MTRRIFLILFFPLLLISCRKDEFTSVINTTPLDPPMVTVAAGIYGQIVDTDGNALEGAEVDIASNITISNENGLFQIREAQLGSSGLGAAVKVTKAGYFQGSTRIFPVRGSQNFVRIQMIGAESSNLVGSFFNTTGGQVSFDGVEINFPVDAVVQSNGEPHIGAVRVVGYWIDPTADDLAEIMPGRLMGFNLENELVGLTTYGMIAVELQDFAGNELEIAPGKTVGIKIPIPSELLASAPAQIPLWSFNEEDIIWEEEGSAELINGAYIGEVSHFSFWNCDVPFPLVQICGQAIDSDGNPLINQTLTIERPDNFSTFAYGTTDDQGNFCGKVPKNELLKISKTNSSCFSTEFLEIGPFSEDTDIGSITLPDGNEGQFDVNGVLLDCNGEGLEGGIVILELSDGNLIAPSDEVGFFSISVSYCGAAPIPLTLQAYDLDGQQQSQDLVITDIPTPDDLFIVQVCDQVIDEYITYTYDGLEVLQPIDYYDIVDSCGVEKITFGGVPVQVNSTFYSASIEFEDLGVGLNSTGQVRARIGQQPPFNTVVWCDLDGPNCSCSSISINITTDSGIVGTPIIGSYTGTVIISGSTNIPTSGEFRVIRQP